MRTLPWKKGSSTTETRPKKSIASVGRSTKRSRVEASPSDSDEDFDHLRKQIKSVNHSREPSTSPPPEPPAERFMEEGPEHDDKYRIVEDELLTVAKSFTVHLHTAEYKRLGKIAKTRNADTINSISRPVVGRMSDATKRKTEEVTRSKDQRNILEKLVGKKEGELSDESDEETLPFVGTSLYGLMASPKKKRGISLMQISSPTKTTRAAAGFRNSTKMKAVQRATSPTMKGETEVMILDPNFTASEDDDDDLDGPISAPKFSSRPSTKKDILYTKPTARLPSAPQPAKSSALPSPKAPATLGPKISKPTNAPTTDSSSQPSTTKDRIARRIAQAKLRKKQEEEDKDKLDIIPTFL
ncbi:hypothetical protein SBOR_6881 [Sclerotinia borealis F-4128]|uniref:Uncharacterized protein n=1 Tax=Sclerotinia borealis (strain F-4128) TaxID=1432307 RepID=W9CA39_SCLBF|nr:hypothetical protein SBOR_6881 [Sclerotinia borealis F-4128]